MSIRSRIEELERTLLVPPRLTLTMLLRAVDGDSGALEALCRVCDDEPLVLMLQAAWGSRALR